MPSALSVAVSIASAVVSIAGLALASPAAPPIVRACDPDLSSRAERASAAHILCELDEPLEIHPAVLGPHHRRAVPYAGAHVSRFGCMPLMRSR